MRCSSIRKEERKLRGGQAPPLRQKSRFRSERNNDEPTESYKMVVSEKVVSEKVASEKVVSEKADSFSECYICYQLAPGRYCSKCGTVSSLLYRTRLTCFLPTDES